MPYTPFRSRRGIHHVFLIRTFERFWRFFWHSSFGLKLVLVGALVSLLGLVFPWASIPNIKNYGAFSSVCGAVGWFIAPLLFAVFVTLFSYDLHEKTKKYLGIVLDPRKVYFNVGVLITLLAIVVNIGLLGAAGSLGSEVQMDTSMSGLIWMLLGGICLIIGGKMVEKSEKKQSYNHIFVQGVEPEEDDAYKKILGHTHDEDNMKLPV